MYHYNRQFPDYHNPYMHNNNYIKKKVRMHCETLKGSARGSRFFPAIRGRLSADEAAPI